MKYMKMLEELNDAKNEGRLEGRTEIMVSLINEGVISMEQGVEKLGISEEELQKYMKH